MQYRTFGKDKRKVSVLGFGCMRLPTDTGKMDGVVQEDEAKRIVRHAIDLGVNYIDTAKVYHKAECEAIVGRILEGGYREKVSVATKLPIWDVETQQDANKIFDQQRRDLKTDKIDVYLLHNLQRGFWPRVEKANLIDWILKKKEKGEIDYAGFSFHDDYDFFVKVVDASNQWDFCQLQYNYVGETMQAGTRGLHYAASKGLSVVIMEPLLGGCLANPSGKMGEMFQTDEGSQYNPVKLALDWLWNLPEVTLVLSGMSSWDQMMQNVQIASESGIGKLTSAELAFITKLKKAYSGIYPIRCTKCSYCMPCPSGVNIPRVFEMYNGNNALDDLSNNTDVFKVLYSMLSSEEKASNCTQCGECLEKCPQKLPIPDLMTKIPEVLKMGS
ncbi:MAG: aldo/keto reductase [Thermoguttaceae bacterium]